jgi:flagella synthesis protein FlgN
LLEEKNRLLSELDRSSQQRASILKASNFPTTKDAWEQLLVDMTDSETQAEWTWRQEELKACHVMNQVNGKLISRSRNTLGHLVNLLKGQVASPELYNQSGVKRSNSQTHTMIKA